MVSISITTWRITATVLAGVGIILTSLRLFYRAKKQRVWVDDILAAFAGLLSLTALPCIWIYTDYPGVGPLNQSPHNRLMAYWVFTGIFIIIIWLTRISLICSLVRTVPPSSSLRQISYIIIALSAFMGIALLTQKILLCYRDHSWQSLTGLDLQCSGNHLTIMATEISLEFFSNILMVAILIRTMIVLETEFIRRWLILVVFFASCLISGASVAHAVFFIRNIGILERFAASIQAFSSLIAINFPALVIFFLLLECPNQEDPDKSDGGGPVARRSSQPQPYARITSMRCIGSPTKLRAFSPASRRESSFYSDEKSPVHYLSPLSQVTCDSRSAYSANSYHMRQTISPLTQIASISASRSASLASTQHTELTEGSDERRQANRLSTFFCERLCQSNSTHRISPAVSSTGDNDPRLSAFFSGLHPPPAQNNRLSPAIASTVGSDGVSLSAYPILNKPPSSLFGGSEYSNRLSREIKNVRFTSPVVASAHSMKSSTISTASPYSMSIYSEYANMPGQEDSQPNVSAMPELPTMPEAIHSTTTAEGQKPFQLPSQILAAMRQQEKPRPSSRPTPF